MTYWFCFDVGEVFEGIPHQCESGSSMAPGHEQCNWIGCLSPYGSDGDGRALGWCTRVLGHAGDHVAGFGGSIPRYGWAAFVWDRAGHQLDAGTERYTQAIAAYRAEREL